MLEPQQSQSAPPKREYPDHLTWLDDDWWRARRGGRDAIADAGRRRRAFQLPPALSGAAGAQAVGMSMLIDIVFGFYPALRASRLDPIVALRVE